MAYYSKSRSFIKRTRGLQTVDQIKSHLGYVGRGSKQLGEEEKDAFFSPTEDRADHKAFIKRIQTNKALQHHLSIKAQKLIFSMRQEDYEAYKRSGRDYKDIVRQALGEYEKRHEVKLDWIANIHAANDAASHPHCHVIIKGVSDVEGDRGLTRIYFKNEDLKAMRRDFDIELENHSRYNFLEKINLDKVIGDMSKSFESVSQAIENEIKKEQLKAERERQYGSMKNRNRGRDR